jgi:DNA uptake protein ComE-like DNA-binding protein
MRFRRSLGFVLASGVLATALAAGVASAARSAKTTPTTTSSATSTKAAPASTSTKVDINSATKAELAKLPGIGDSYSEKIIAGRPYKAKSDLVSKKILPQHVYDKIAPHIIAKQK